MRRPWEKVSAPRHHHELLDVHIVGSVGSPVQDVHHGNGKKIGLGSPQVLVQGKAGFGGGGPGSRHGRRQDGVGAQSALVRSAIQLNEGSVDVELLPGLEPSQGITNLLVEMPHRLQDALAKVALRILVPQLHRLVLPGGRSTGNGGTAPSSRLENDLRLHGGVASGVQDLPSFYIHDGRHSVDLVQ